MNCKKIGKKSKKMHVLKKKRHIHLMAQKSGKRHSNA